MNNHAAGDETIDGKLLGILLRPSLMSGSIAALAGLAVLFGPVIAAHTGEFARQDFTGLHDAFSQSQLGVSANIAGTRISENAFVNNILLFLLWGSVGLVVYLVVQSIMNGLKNADDVVQEFGYVHADWHKIIIGAIWRAAIRLIALAAWWIVLKFLLFNLLPYAWSSSQYAISSGLGLAGWQRSILAACGCMLAVHCLAVLLRLVFLRPRIIGSVIV